MFYGGQIEYKGASNVEANFQTYFKLLTNKAMALFNFKNLPSTINEAFLKETLILNGKICFTQFNGTDLYCLNGNYGGEPNAYYLPTQWIVANPVLGSKVVKVRQRKGDDSIDGLEGVVVHLTPIDTLSIVKNGGLFNLIYKYSGLLADNDVSLNIAQINGRLSVAFTADSEALAATAESVLKDIYEGRPYKILSQDILNKIQVVPIAQQGVSNQLMGLIEAHSHLLQDFYSEIGISSNGNLKRERLNTAETELMQGCLAINLSLMEQQLKADIDKVNELFGTSIEVEINRDIFSEDSTNAHLESTEDQVEVQDQVEDQETKTEDEKEKESEDE